MTKSELIAVIERLIERLDVLGGSIPEGESSQQLDELRDQLSAQQLQLIQEQFDENTAAFKQATTQLAAINADLKATITQIGRLLETINNVKRFVSAVDQIIGTAVAIV